jgi:hypothetical protein
MAVAAKGDEIHPEDPGSDGALGFLARAIRGALQLLGEAVPESGGGGHKLLIPMMLPYIQSRKDG